MHRFNFEKYFFILFQPPSEGELSVTSGILGRLHRWKNESSVSTILIKTFRNETY